MLTLEKAFVTGIATPSLLQLWERTNCKVGCVYENSTFRIVGMWALVFGFLSLYPAWDLRQHSELMSALRGVSTVIGCAGLIAILFGAICVWVTSGVTNYTKKFIDDCINLRSLVVGVESYSQNQLHAFANRKLTDLSIKILLTQQKSDGKAVNILIEMRRQFDTYKRFGMAAVGGYEYYFDRAKREIISKKEATQVASWSGGDC